MKCLQCKQEMDKNIVEIGTKAIFGASAIIEVKIEHKCPEGHHTRYTYHYKSFDIE